MIKRLLKRVRDRRRRRAFYKQRQAQVHHDDATLSLSNPLSPSNPVTLADSMMSDASDSRDSSSSSWSGSDFGGSSSSGGFSGGGSSFSSGGGSDD